MPLFPNITDLAKIATTHKTGKITEFTLENDPTTYRHVVIEHRDDGTRLAEITTTAGEHLGYAVSETWRAWTDSPLNGGELITMDTPRSEHGPNARTIAEIILGVAQMNAERAYRARTA